MLSHSSSWSVAQQENPQYFTPIHLYYTNSTRSWLHMDSFTIPMREAYQKSWKTRMKRIYRKGPQIETRRKISDGETGLLNHSLPSRDWSDRIRSSEGEKSTKYFPVPLFSSMLTMRRTSRGVGREEAAGGFLLHYDSNLKKQIANQFINQKSPRS